MNRGLIEARGFWDSGITDPVLPRFMNRGLIEADPPISGTAPSNYDFPDS